VGARPGRRGASRYGLKGRLAAQASKRWRSCGSARRQRPRRWVPFRRPRRLPDLRDPSTRWPQRAGHASSDASADRTGPGGLWTGRSVSAGACARRSGLRANWAEVGHWLSGMPAARPRRARERPWRGCAASISETAELRIGPTPAPAGGGAYRLPRRLQLGDHPDCRTAQLQPAATPIRECEKRAKPWPRR